jgi:hypothetical protein
MTLNRRHFAAGLAAAPAAAGLTGLTGLSAFAQDAGTTLGPRSERADSFATQAYIYGYPLVTMELTRRASTNVEAPAGTKAPMGQFASLRGYPDASFRTITAPNADTLYSVAWVDLSNEPVVLSIPEMPGRFFLFPMLDAWTNVFAVPGSRTTGTGAQTYVIAGPGWKGTLPQPFEIIRAPTNLVWILGRIYCTGTPEDYKAVHAIQDKLGLVPLSAWGKPWTPPKGKVDPAWEGEKVVRSVVNRMDGASYFALLADLMKSNLPGLQDGVIAAKLSTLGIVPGKPFDIGKLNAAARQAIEDAPAQGLARIKAHEAEAGVMVNGWTFSTRTGFYGQNYIQRAFVTLVGLGANLPQDAIYPMARVDAEGRPFSGANRYVIRFPAGRTPPVKGFWSLTMYDEEMFFVANPLNRYSVSPRNNLKAGPDGSIELLVQADDPGPDKQSNWLPAPKGRFNLMFRFYQPDAPILDGRWAPPPVTKVG